jgi:predicted ATPase/signal transduction histidine kinase
MLQTPRPAILADSARQQTQAESFDEQWLRQVHWSAIDQDGELVRWRVRSPQARRAWLVLRPRPGAADSAFHRLAREYDAAPCLQAAWAILPIAQLNTPEGPLLMLDDDGGRPLSQLADGQLSVERFLRLATSAATALAGAHAQNLTHNDLKPANLMLGPNGKVRLTGFALARHPSLPPPATGISGSLPYMAPEQCARLDWVADQRADLYALGVSFYELLTGHLPLEADDPVAWLHQQVAVPPRPLAFYRQDLPPPLQALLDALLAKSPGERLPSARVLEAQLRLALTEWSEFGHLSTGLGQLRFDARAQPAMPVLRGRGRSLQLLVDAGQRLSRGLPGGVALISGAAGMGKTVLVRQLRREMASGHVLFAGSKFESGKTTRPYAAVAAVLGSLMQRLLGEDAEQLAQWRERLQTATAPHGEWLARLVPELAWVLGPLPGSPESPSGDVRLRLLHLLVRVLRCFCQPRHPLIVFFDDLHWLDAESLLLFQELNSEDFGHLLLVATYRSDPAHDSAVLQAFIQYSRQLHVPRLEIALQPLPAEDALGMTREALDLPADAAEHLAAELHERTGGNPLFLTQALQCMGEQSGPAALWVLPTSRDIVALMTTRLGHLPGATAQVLHSMALLGSRVERRELAQACELAPADLDALLQPALQALLIREDHDGLSFCHDHVQDAARVLPDPTRPARAPAAEHALIGWRLAAGLGDAPTPARLFRTAVHLTQADATALPATWRPRFIEVLMQAATAARESAAVPLALACLTQAQSLLDDREPAESGLRYRIAFLRAQCLILAASYAQADEQIALLLADAQAPAAVASLYVLKSEILSLAGDYAAAVDTALAGLATLGLTISAEPAPGAAEQAWQALQQVLGARDINRLDELPELTDPRLIGQIELLACAAIPGSFIQPDLMFVLLCHLVRLSVAEGISAAATHGLAWFGVACAHRRDAQAEGLEWALLALRLIEQRGYAERKAGALLALDQVSVWLRPLPFALDCAERAMRSSLARDLPSICCYANNHIVSNLLVMGAPIERILRQIDTGLGMARNQEYVDSQNILYIQALYIRRLAGATHSALALPSREQMAVRIGQSRMGPARFWWHLFEGLFFFLEGQFNEAREHLDRAWALSWATPAHIHLIDLAFFGALNATALLDSPADGLTLAASQVDLQRAMERLERYAALNPKAFADRLDLARAQVLLVEGQSLEALRLYDVSIAKALACGAVHIQGLAHELASRCHARLGLAVSARAHQRQARDCWRRWGAVALAEQMEAAHPWLQDAPVASRSSIDLPMGQDHLDRMSITKACQALSREIDIDPLIKTLVSNTLVHAGANYAVLLLLDDGSLRVQAIGRASHEGVQVTLQSHGAQPHELPLGLVRSAMHSRRSKVMADMDDPAPFAEDPYWLQRCQGAALCVPLLKQSEVIGALYLENSLTPGAFNPARIDVLELLAAQAAISIERHWTETALRNARTELARSSQAAVLGELAASIAHEINQPLSAILSNASASVRWLKREAPQVEEAIEGLRDIQLEGQRAADIVSALRSLACQAEPQRQAVSLQEVIQHVLSATRAEWQDTSTLVELTLAPQEPVLADPVQLQQVILNLINNAVEAMLALPPSQRRLRLETCSMPGGALVMVEDNGPGIEVGQLADIFKAFYTTKASGMGMGLAICSSIVAAHGGQLLALTTRENKTLFAFSLRR